MCIKEKDVIKQLVGGDDVYENKTHKYNSAHNKFCACLMTEKKVKRKRGVQLPFLMLFKTCIKRGLLIEGVGHRE